jgi:hypothetical protein
VPDGEVEPGATAAASPTIVVAVAAGIAAVAAAVWILRRART